MRRFVHFVKKKNIGNKFYFVGEKKYLSRRRLTSQFIWDLGLILGLLVVVFNYLNLYQFYPKNMNNMYSYCD